MRKILIIEDDKALSKILKETLTDFEYHVVQAYNRKETLLVLKNEEIDLCLLDVRLPDGDGVELCRQMREFFDGSIIMVTACGSIEEVVEGLKSGADDYITKPFDIQVLLARIEAQLRRTTEKRGDISQVLFSGDLVVYKDKHQIFCGGKSTELSRREYLVCELLLENRGRIVTREMFLDQIWDARENYVDESTLNVHISRIRSKLGNFQGTSYIETIKGFGYRWSCKIIQN